MIEILLALYILGGAWTWGDYKYGEGVKDCSDLCSAVCITIITEKCGKVK